MDDSPFDPGQRNPIAKRPAARETPMTDARAGDAKQRSDVDDDVAAAAAEQSPKKEYPEKKQRADGGALQLDRIARAREALRLSRPPVRLPCRDDERRCIHNFIADALNDGFGASMYISGMPGSGKTATVREVITKLKADCRVPFFDHVEINALRLDAPEQVYSELWHRVSGESIPPGRSKDRIHAWFVEHRSTVTLVVLADEIDHMRTSKDDVLYNLFDWPTRAGSRLVVIGVANTMDLPERLPPKIGSRLGLKRLTFGSYSREQLQTIAADRLGTLHSVFGPGAIEMASRKVAAVSGDARRFLQICARACDALGCRAEHTQITVADIMQASCALENNPYNLILANATHLELLLLASVVAEKRATIGAVSIAAVRSRAARVYDQDLSHAETLELASSLAQNSLLTMSASSDLSPGPILELSVPESLLEDHLRSLGGVFSIHSVNRG